MSWRRAPGIVKDSRSSAVDPSTGLPLYGIDKDLADKAAAKFDPALQAQAQGWLEELTGKPFPGEFMESLKNGVVLCEAMNVVKPGAIRRINASRMPFKQMENISNFLSACRQLGMSEYDLFTTVALFEAKDRNAVINGIVAFGRLAQKIGFRGPTIGVKESSKNTRHFTKEQLSRSNGQVSKLNMGGYGIQERSAMDTSRNITFGAQKAGAAVPSAGVSKLNMGSAGIMDRGAVDTSRNITFGAEKAGKTYGGVSKLNMGSAGIMDRGAVDTSRNITFGAEKAGKTYGGVSKLNMGSAGVMDRGAIDTSRNITFGAQSSGAAAPSTGVNKWNQGSSSTMQRGGIDRTRDINFGANAGRR